MKFEELNLKENLLRGITDAGFITLMPVQEETLVHTLKGRDAYVQSQTGTGKTAAFMVTIFQHFLDEDSPIKKKKALIIAPTRELAAQIEEDAQTIGRYLDFTVGCFYGGIGYDKQERLLEKGVDIIIGTPGRLLDFYSKKKLDFDAVGILVIDEADRLFGDVCRGGGSRCGQRRGIDAPSNGSGCLRDGRYARGSLHRDLLRGLRAGGALLLRDVHDG